MSEVATKRALDPITILQGVADGLTIKEIAADLQRNYASLKNAMREHYDKTGATGISHALAQAMRAGKIH